MPTPLTYSAAIYRAYLHGVTARKLGRGQLCPYTLPELIRQWWRGFEGKPEMEIHHDH